MLVARNEVLDCSNPKLDVYLSKAGVAINVETLEYQIFDISDAAKKISPVQVYPVSVGTRATVDTTQDCPVGGRIATGHFAAAWTVPADETLGSHELRWFYKETASTPEESFSEEFEVSSVTASSADLYIQVQDVRDAGVTTAMVPLDSDIETAIKINQAFIDRATRQWFLPRTLTVYLDGNSSDTLFLPVPVISVSSLRINDQSTDLDSSLYRVYSSDGIPDDRRNPRITLVRGDVDLYSDPFHFNQPLLFKKGRQNQQIVGSFGFVESDGSPPELIKRALLLLVIEKLVNPPLGTPLATLPSGPSGSVLRETTDGHTVQYTFVKYSDTRAGWSGYTMNREVHTILNIYKSPIGIAAPSARWLDV